MKLNPTALCRSPRAFAARSIAKGAYLCVSLALAATAVSLLILLVHPSAGLADPCPNEQLRREDNSLALPDCRAYEQVSPANKAGGFVNYPAEYTSAESANGATIGSLTGERVLFSSIDPFPGSVSGNIGSYLAERTAEGWKSISLAPATPVGEQPSTVFRSVVTDATPNLDTLFFEAGENLDPLDQDGSSDGTESSFDVYLRRYTPPLGAGPFEWVSRPDDGGPSNVHVRAKYEGSSSDGRHVIFATSERLTAAAEGLLGTGAAGDPEGIYDRTEGHTVLVDVNTDGSVTSKCGADLGNYLTATGATAYPGNAVSNDGSHIVFKTPAGNGIFYPDPSCEAPSQLYDRIDNQTTVQISASQRTTPDPGGTQPAKFEGASADGTRVFFESTEALTDSALLGGDHLYEFDVDTGELALVGAGELPNGVAVIGLSEDGTNVYYIAEVAGATQLHRETAGDDEVVADLEANDFGLLSNQGSNRQVRLSGDGLHLVFASTTNLTSKAAGSTRKLYLYDAVRREIVCVSCRSDGSAPSANATLTNAGQEGIDEGQYPRGHNVSYDGSRVFFETADPLSSRDDDAVPGNPQGEGIDVYEWENGSVYLISSGHSSYGSFFVDASPDGRDVFFTTTDGLVGQDTDHGDRDIYDARVEGGFSAPVIPAQACTGDECQGAQAPTPVLSSAASASVFGSGNLAAPIAKPTRKATTHKAKKRKVKKKPKRKKKSGKAGKASKFPKGGKR